MTSVSSGLGRGSPAPQAALETGMLSADQLKLAPAVQPRSVADTAQVKLSMHRVMCPCSGETNEVLRGV